MQTRAPISAPSSAAQFSSVSKSKTIQKATQQTFYQFAPDEHVDIQRINIFSSVRDKFGLD